MSTRMVLAPDPAWRGIAGRARRARAAPVVAVGAAAAAIGIGSAAVAGGLVGGPPPAVTVPSESPSSTPGVTPTPTPTARPTPTPSPSPSLSPTPTATQAPTASPAPTEAPPPPQQYVVQQGDTLAAIAQQFGTTVPALQDLNGIEDPNEIVVGQVLQIP